MAEHILKTDPAVFDAVASGAKTHEIRLNDRDFKVGDTLILRRTKWTGALMKTKGYPLEFTGEECRRVVSHILGEGGEGSGYGLHSGWCILSFAPCGVKAAAKTTGAMLCSACEGTREITLRGTDTREPCPQCTDGVPGTVKLHQENGHG